MILQASWDSYTGLLASELSQNSRWSAPYRYLQRQASGLVKRVNGATPLVRQEAGPMTDGQQQLQAHPDHDAGIAWAEASLPEAVRRSTRGQGFVLGAFQDYNQVVTLLRRWPCLGQSARQRESVTGAVEGTPAAVALFPAAALLPLAGVRSSIPAFSLNLGRPGPREASVAPWISDWWG